MLDPAASYHPHWRKLSHKARLLIARNGTQILGPDLTSPVALIVCWTEGGMPEVVQLRLSGSLLTPGGKSQCSIWVNRRSNVSRLAP